MLKFTAGSFNMTSILQCSPPVWVNTPKGEGFTHFLFDYGIDHNSVWVVALFDTGEVIHVDSSEIRVMGNEMLNIPHPKPIKERQL